MADPAHRIAYIVHDVNDAAVARRIAMMREGGLEVVLIGFRRDARRPLEVAGAPVTDLGLTGDGRLARRIVSVVGILARPAALMRAVADCDVLVARNLESLALATRARRGRAGVRLVYECLDIHRMLLGSSIASRAIQRIERWLLSAIDLLIVSSPAFARAHFANRLPTRVPVLLAENKVLALSGRLEPPAASPPAPPWTIGWFGNLRCRRTFDILRAVAAQGEGRVQILIAGRASPAEFDDFERQVADAPHCTYTGPYSVSDLPRLYARCHFAWAIDYFEEGLNSTWLLPNRLYEASSARVVPVALRAVETGQWLDRHDAGVQLGEGDPVAQMVELLGQLDRDGYSAMRAKVAAIPREDLIAGPEECRALVAALIGA